MISFVHLAHFDQWTTKPADQGQGPKDQGSRRRGEQGTNGLGGLLRISQDYFVVDAVCCFDPVLILV